MQKVTLALFYPGCIEFEIMLALELLNATYPVQTVTPKGKPHQGNNGLIYQANYSFKTAPIEDAKVILIPGGDPGSVVENPDLNHLLTKAKSQSSTFLGAICAGPLLLAKAGLLKGHKFTHGYGRFNYHFLAPFWEGAYYTDAPVVVSKNIITAQPQAHIDFATELARLAKVYQKPERSQEMNAYYKGQKLKG